MYLELVKVNEYKRHAITGVLNLIINKTTELSSITNDIHLESSRIIKSDFIPTTIAYNVSEKR